MNHIPTRSYNLTRNGSKSLSITIPSSFIESNSLVKGQSLYCYEIPNGVLYTPSPISSAFLSALLSIKVEDKDSKPKEPRKPGRPKKKEEQEEEPKPQFRLGPHGELLDPSVKDIKVVPVDPSVSGGLEAMFRAEIAGKIPQK